MSTHSSVGGGGAQGVSTPNRGDSGEGQESLSAVWPRRAREVSSAQLPSSHSKGRAGGQSRRDALRSALSCTHGTQHHVVGHTGAPEGTLQLLIDMAQDPSGHRTEESGGQVSSGRQAARDATHSPQGHRKGDAGGQAAISGHDPGVALHVSSKHLKGVSGGQVTLVPHSESAQEPSGQGTSPAGHRAGWSRGSQFEATRAQVRVWHSTGEWGGQVGGVGRSSGDWRQVAPEEHSGCLVLWWFQKE